MQLKRRRPSAGTVIGTVALIFAVTGVAGALPGKNSVDSNDIRKGAVKTKHLAKNAVAPKARAVVARSTGFTNLSIQDAEVVLSKNAPAGRYAVAAKLSLYTNGDGDYSCRIRVNEAAIDEQSVNPPTGAGSQTRGVALLGVAKLSDPGVIDVHCSSGATTGTVRDVQIVATAING